jgi:hypothetical protein
MHVPLLSTGNTSNSITISQDWGGTEDDRPDNTSSYIITGSNTWTVLNEGDVENDNECAKVAEGDEGIPLTWNLVEEE